MPSEDVFEAALDDLMAEVWPMSDSLNRDPELLGRVLAMRLVYADWLEERGDPRAGAQRWMAQEKKFPRRFYKTWGWWGFGDTVAANHEDLPSLIWMRMPGAPPTHLPRCKEYDSRRDAERALYTALMLLDLLT